MASAAGDSLEVTVVVVSALTTALTAAAVVVVVVALSSVGLQPEIRNTSAPSDVVTRRPARLKPSLVGSRWANDGG